MNSPNKKQNHQSYHQAFLYFWLSGKMEWTRLLLSSLIIFCVLPSVCFGYGDTFPRAVRSKINNSHLPCYQDFYFKSKRATCSYRDLKRVPDYLFPDTILILLSYNDIRMLYNTSFLRYPLVDLLTLNCNNIEYIEYGAFEPLSHLNVLVLDYNDIHNLDNGGFLRHARSLGGLTLGGNNLRHLPNETLRWLPRIYDLAIQSNRFEYINFSYCPNHTMGAVFLSYRSIASITNETFRFTCKCKKMYLEDNNFTRVDPGTVSTLHVSHLGIGFSNYSLYSSQPYNDLLKGIALSSIESLAISLPQYGFFLISNNFFDPLRGKHLSVLKITGKALRLNSSIFKYPTHIKRLVISYTNGEFIFPEFFEGICGLQALDLHHNKFVFFNPRLTTWNLTISQLDLSHNKLNSLSDDAFTGLDFLEHLDLSDNEGIGLVFRSVNPPLANLQHLDVSGSSFTVRGPFKLPKLRSFSLSHRIYEVLMDSFFNPERLKYSLHIERIIAVDSHVTLVQLWSASQKSSMFDGLNHLELIDLSSNDLRELPQGLFPKLPVLISLNLSNCKISVLEAGVIWWLGITRKIAFRRQSY